MRAYLALFLPAVLAVSVPCAATDTWEDLMPGVRHLHRVTATPQDIHVVTVDLTNPRVRLRTGLKNDNDYPDGGETVRSMCQRYDAVAGINCDYFAFTADQWNDHRHIPQGHTMTDGLLMLPPGHTTPIVPDRSALAINSSSNYVLINAFMTPGTWWWNVTAGGPRIIRNGTVGWESEPNIPSQTNDDPRTGAAISQNGHTLILATVDGRQVESQGMDANELGSLLQEFGGYQGLSYDGGGSTTMVVNGTTVNHPCYGDRLIANCLMVMDKLRQGSNPAVRFESDFENPPYPIGALGGIDGWVGGGEVTSGGRNGGQCAHFANASAYRNVSASSLTGVQWFECWVKSSSTNSNAYIYAGTANCASVASALRFASGGQIQAYDTDELGSPVWVNLATYTADTWYRIHFRLDYNINSYQAFINGALKISGATFLDSGASSGLRAIEFEEVGGTSDFYVDDIYAGNVDPDFVRVSPDSITIVAGGRKLFKALGGTPPVTWSVVDEKDSGGNPVSPGTTAQMSLTGLLTANAAGTCAVQTQDSIGRVDKSATITVVPGNSVAGVKAMNNGSTANVSGLIVAGVFNGFIYAQEADRRSGIRIVTATPVALGNEIWATGTVGISDGERVITTSRLEVSP